jgi:hypothetical protein
LELVSSSELPGASQATQLLKLVEQPNSIELVEYLFPSPRKLRNECKHGVLNCLPSTATAYTKKNVLSPHDPSFLSDEQPSLSQAPVSCARLASKLQPLERVAMHSHTTLSSPPRRALRLIPMVRVVPSTTDCATSAFSLPLDDQRSNSSLQYPTHNHINSMSSSVVARGIRANEQVTPSQLGQDQFLLAFVH